MALGGRMIMPMNSIFRLAFVLTAFCALALAPAAFAELPNCLECHDNLTQGSVHEDNAECAECHEDVQDESHEEAGVRAVNCGVCHEELAESLGRDIHHRLKERVGDEGPDCTSCHGDHQIASPDASKDRVAEFCSDCHDNVMLVNPYHSLGSVPDQQCLECHEDAADFPSHIAASAHRELACSDCHAYSALHLEEHQDDLPFDQVADCFLCHRKEALEHHDSIHGISIYHVKPDRVAVHHVSDELLRVYVFEPSIEIERLKSAPCISPSTCSMIASLPSSTSVPSTLARHSIKLLS